MDVIAEREAIFRDWASSEAALLAAIEGLSESQLSERSIDGWSVKDHFAHLAQWHELRWLDLVRLAAGYESAVNGTPEQEEVYNAMMVEWRAGLSWQQSLWEWQTSRARVLDTLRAMTPAELDRVLRDTWPLHTGHEDQHAGYRRLARTAGLRAYR